MKTWFKRLTALALILVLALSLSACENVAASNGIPSPAGTGLSDSAGASAEPDASPSPSSGQDPYDAVKHHWSADQLTQKWGPDQVVEHLFFHPLIAYPDVAFSSSDAKGLDDWMVTVDEFDKMLQSIYDNNYILVNINDVWSEYTDANGNTRMKRNTLLLPEGKKPLILSFDDVNYYPYMIEEGFMSKLILGDDGQIWAQGTDPHTGQTVVTQDLDATTILDKFVLQHPDFSLNGAKATMALTGFSGILGYRTQTDRDVTDPAQKAAFEENRQKEIAAVKPIIARLKETGWTFASHTWGHIRLSDKSLAAVKDDTQRWADEVGSLVGPTDILIYPHGARPDGDDVKQTGPVFQYLQSQGFRVFASVGVESFSKIKSDISAVICDRMHADGTTLRWQRGRYLKFYDAANVMDLKNRPDLGYDFNK